MGWDSAPPTETELKAAAPAWDTTPPKKEELTDAKKEGGETLKIGPVEFKNVKLKPSQNSWLYDFVTGAQGKNAIEPTTAAQIMAPAAYSTPAKIASELGEGAIAGETPQALQSLVKYGKKILPYAASAIGVNAITRRLGGH